MPQRVIIVGGVAGGASCAARLRRMDEEAEIIVLEKGEFVSFANCGLPYHVGDVIQEEGKLLLANPALFHARFRIDVRLRCEVVAIDPARRHVTVLNHAIGQSSHMKYDRLVLSPGSVPIIPPIEGLDREGIFRCLTIPDVRAIRGWIEGRSARSAVVIGGGYIGLEIAENLAHRGLKVTVVEMTPHIMPLADPEMVAALQDHVRENGIELRLSEKAVRIADSPDACHAVELESGASIPADLVVLSVGGRPNSALAESAGLKLGLRGAIVVDAQQRTSDPNIFAVGDAVEVADAVSGGRTVIALAGPANRQGRIAADVIAGRGARLRPLQGTSVVGVFGMTMASTGYSEKALCREGMPYEKVYLFPANHVGYYPGASPIHLKLLFAPGDGRVLGATAVGMAGAERRIDVIAAFLQMRATVFDLEEAELCYAPPYGGAKDPVNFAGFIAANHLRGDAPLVHWDALAYAADKPLVLDVREPKEYEAGHVEGALNIPLGHLRERLGELPRDRPVWAHCGVGQRSHYAVRILRQHGFDARNLSGGYTQYVRHRKAGMVE